MARITEFVVRYRGAERCAYEYHAQADRNQFSTSSFGLRGPVNGRGGDIYLRELTRTTVKQVLMLRCSARSGICRVIALCTIL